MAITNTVQRGQMVYIYNEKNQVTSTVSAGTGKDDGLKGYTGSTVNIKRGAFIYTHNERGQVIGQTHAG